MAIGTPTVGTYTEGASASTTVVPYPATVNAGDLILLCGGTRAASSSAVTTPAGYTQVAQLAGAAGTILPTAYVGRKIAAGTEGGTTITVTHSLTPSTWQILAFSGVDNTTPLDVAATTFDGTTITTDLPSQTIVTTGAAQVAVAANTSTTGNATPPTGFTETGDRVSGSVAVEMSYILGLGTGATGTRSVTWGTAVRNVGILVALRPAGATPAARRRLNTINQAASNRASVY